MPLRQRGAVQRSNLPPREIDFGERGNALFFLHGKYRLGIGLRHLRRIAEAA